jgi:ribosome-associated protein
MTAARAASDKKAERIVIMNISQLLVITDYFLICSGRTERQVRTISEEIERCVLAERDLKPFRREGEREGRWVLLDYIDFVVHIFHVDDREYYNLERLWSDAPTFRFDESLEEPHEPAAAEAT